MRITIEPTQELGIISGRAARRWQGITDAGTTCDVWVCLIGVPEEHCAEFDRAVERHLLLEVPVKGGGA